MELGTAIRDIRRQKGYNQKELAAKTGLSVNTLCLIECNNTFPQKGTIDKICEELKISMAYLLLHTVTDINLTEEKKEIFNDLLIMIKKIAS